MPRYIIQSTHTPEQCLQTLDTILAQGQDQLARWDFGCAVGDHSNHIAYSVFEAADALGAGSFVPTPLRAGAQISEVGKFTGEQIRAFHA